MFLAPEFYGLALMRFICEGVGFVVFILKVVIVDVIPKIPELECVEKIARLSRKRLTLKNITVRPIPVTLEKFAESAVPFRAKFEYFIDSNICTER